MTSPAGNRAAQLESSVDKLTAQIDRLEKRRKQFEKQGKDKQADSLAADLERQRQRLKKTQNQLKREQAANEKSPMSLSADELIRQAYLRTLSRLPQAEEQAVARKYLADSESTVAGMKDLLWALLNTKEFIVNR